jgi:prepilin-type processing-associated H-X9-DG protein
MDPQICQNCGKKIPEDAESCECRRRKIAKEAAGAKRNLRPSRLASGGAWIGISAFLCAVGFLLISWGSKSVSYALPEWAHKIFHPILFRALLNYVIPGAGMFSFLLTIWYEIQKQPINSRRSLKSLLVNGLIVVIVAVSVPWLSKGRQVTRPGCELCPMYLRQLGLLVDLYASENAGRYPFIDDVRNNFIFESALLYPELLTTPEIISCPMDPNYHPSINFRLASNKSHPDFRPGDVHPDCFTDFSYCYLGWIVTSDEEMEAFLEAYDQLSPEDYDKDIVVPEGKGNGGGNVIHRLDKKLFTSAVDGQRKYPGIFLIDSGKTGADIPIMWDKPSLNKNEFNHMRYRNRPSYGNVVLLDGHVEEVPFPGKFPMTETMAKLLDERPRAPIPDCEE